MGQSSPQMSWLTGNKAKITGLDANSQRWPKVSLDYVNSMSVPIPQARTYKTYLNYSSPTVLKPGNQRWKSSALSTQTSAFSPDQEYFNEMRLKRIVDIGIKCCHLISTVCLICTQLWNVIRTRELYWGLPHYRDGFPEGSELICLKIKCVYINTWGKQAVLQT